MDIKAKLRTLMVLLIIVMMAPGFVLPAEAAGLSKGLPAVSQVRSGAAGSGIVTSKGKKYYYLKGKRKTGKVRVGKKWYYFGPEMKTGLIEDTGKSGTYYYAGQNGVLQTGWKTVKGKKYYFWTKTRGGHTKFEAATGLKSVGGKYYLFSKKGVLLSGLQKVGGSVYYADSKGLVKSGWHKAGGSLRYFYPKAGSGHARFEMASGTVVIDGVPHYLDSDGIPEKTHGGKDLNRYGAEKKSAEASGGSRTPTSDGIFYGDVTAGRTPAQKAILSCLNYYEDQLQKLNRENRFEETYNKKGDYTKHVWQYSNNARSPLNAFFAPFDRMNSGAFKKGKKTVRYCNCDSCKWWVVQDMLNTTGTTSEGMHTVWTKYTIKGMTFEKLYEKGYFTVKKDGEKVRIDLVPGTCFYDAAGTHTWIYMGPDRKGVERFFDTGHGGVHSDPNKVDKVLAWEEDVSKRYHSDKRRAIFRTWINEITDSRAYADKTIRVIWVPRNIRSFYYRNPRGKLVKY
ncbi:MAG: hypothetical protein IKI23_02750 [Lachnospiraceae bacterium]|nr:hypothetical protein [Lachnospiraceae bacterium]